MTQGLCKLCIYLGISHHTLIFYLFTIGPATELLHCWKESLATHSLSLEARDQVSLSTCSLAGMNIFSPSDLKTIQKFHCMHRCAKAQRERRKLGNGEVCLILIHDYEEHTPFYLSPGLSKVIFKDRVSNVIFISLLKIREY